MKTVLLVLATALMYFFTESDNSGLKAIGFVIAGGILFYGITRMIEIWKTRQAKR